MLINKAINANSQNQDRTVQIYLNIGQTTIKLKTTERKKCYKVISFGKRLFSLTQTHGQNISVLHKQILHAILCGLTLYIPPSQLNQNYDKQTTICKYRLLPNIRSFFLCLCRIYLTKTRMCQKFLVDFFIGKRYLSGRPKRVVGRLSPSRQLFQPLR